VRESLRSRGWVEQFYRDELSHGGGNGIKLPLTARKPKTVFSDHNLSDSDSDANDMAYDDAGNVINGLILLAFVDLLLFYKVV